MNIKERLGKFALNMQDFVNDHSGTLEIDGGFTSILTNNQVTNNPLASIISATPEISVDGLARTSIGKGVFKYLDHIGKQLDSELVTNGLSQDSSAKTASSRPRKDNKADSDAFEM